MLKPRSEPSTVIDTAEFQTAIWRYRWLIVLAAVLGAVAFGVLTLLMTPKYRSTAVLIPVSPDRKTLGGSLTSLGSLGDLASLAGFNLPDNGASEESLAVLSSQQFTQKFIEEHQLMPKLYPKLWDAATGKWKVPPDEQPTAAKAYKRFDKMRTITKNSKTGLISLDLDWRDRLEAASLVNTLVEKVNAEMRQRATQNADVSMRYLQHELTVTADIGTVDSLNRLMQTEIRQKMLADVTEEYAFKFVDRALPPDVDDPISPKKMILVPAGFLLGLVMGVVGALILHSLRQPRAGVD